MVTPSVGSNNFLVEEEEEDKPVTGMVVNKRVAKEQAAAAVSRNKRRLEKAEQAVHNDKLALDREENSDMRSEKTLRFLAGQLKTAQKEKRQATKDLEKKHKTAKKRPVN